MNPFIIGGAVVGFYSVVGIFVYALCKTAANADRAMERMMKND